MNKIDLEILEIVKDYTNKELVEGCIIKWNSNSYVVDWKYYTIWEHKDGYCNIIVNLEFERVEFTRDDWWMWIEAFNIEEILWQLEVTAVLRYIANKLSWSIVIQSFSNNNLHFLYHSEHGVETVNIPNKPYNTYTKTEKIELRDLLLTIK